MKPIKIHGHVVTLDEYMNVGVTDPDGGMIKEQSVDTFLLLCILTELQKLNAKRTHERNYE